MLYTQEVNLDGLIRNYFYHTLVDTSFKLISDFCHVNQGVLCFQHAEQASSSSVFEGGGGGGGATGLLNKGGGSNRLPVEFPQVQTSI